ncbi:monovalent cation/H+ antiporter subunit D [Pseudomonas aeruginosa]|nr:monovalent cation/H+ antiporter subunit D [Pseudomonas aeruginosa]
MSHWLILPILLPLFAGSLLLLPLAERWRRGLSLLAALALIPLSLLLMRTAASGDLSVYALGNWAAPFGIVLMLDRLAALMLLATAVLGSAALIYALRGDDRLGKHFHALFQFQLLGINGAFLTGDLFNLFVFFEILLIASYALLLHGGGAERVRSGLHYVILNLVGSAFFLIAVGTLYGLTGTLNMADMAQKIAMADAERAPLLAAAGLLLLVVFALKAALLPLYFWLPRAYAAASAPVAALFAIMTKVGIYSILRVYTLVFGEAAGELANLAQAWLWPLALATLGLGAIGALAARTLQGLLAYLVVVSAGNPPGWRGVGQRAGAGGVAVLPAAQYLDRRWPVPARRPGRPPARRQGRRPGPGPGVAESSVARRGFLHRRHRRCRSAAIVGVLRQDHAFAVGRSRQPGAGPVERGTGQWPGGAGGVEPGRQHAVLAYRAYRAR